MKSIIAKTWDQYEEDWYEQLPYAYGHTRPALE